MCVVIVPGAAFREHGTTDGFRLLYPDAAILHGPERVKKKERPEQELCPPKGTSAGADW